MDFFHDGMRELQDRYEGRAVPDRLAANRMRKAFNETDREFIETSPFFLPGNIDARQRRLLVQGGRAGISSGSSATTS